MTDYLYYLLLGTGAGAIIAALGLGLVITYQGSGVVNFAYGAMAMWVGLRLRRSPSGRVPVPDPGSARPVPLRRGDVGFRWAMPLALLTAVAARRRSSTCSCSGRCAQAPALAKIVASIGLVIVFTSLVDRRFSDKPSLRVDPILPREPVTITDDLTVPRDGLWLWR